MVSAPRKAAKNRLRVRKQVYDLTAADLRRHPVWKFALDETSREGQDEATVKPFGARGKLDPARGMFAVRARLTLADGTQLTGHLQPPLPGESDVAGIHPTAVVSEGQVPFWCGYRVPSKSERTECYARLGKRSAREVFPLRFESDVPLTHGPVAGMLEGFMVLEEGRRRRTRILK